MTKSESEDRLARALEALGQADFPAAISLLEELVVEDSTNAQAWSQLGVCYLETQRTADAVEALARAVQAAPTDAQTQYLLGNACGTMGQLDRAAACYRKALELDPHHVQAEEFLMRVESLMESREHYRTSLSLLYSRAPVAGGFEPRPSRTDPLRRHLREFSGTRQLAGMRAPSAGVAARTADLHGRYARTGALGRRLRAGIPLPALQELGRGPGGLRGRTSLSCWGRLRPPGIGIQLLRARPTR